LTASGLDKGSFCFEGFLPKDKSSRRKALAKLADEARVMVFYEAPHRILATLADMELIFGEERSIAVGRELTKMYEEIKRGSIHEMIQYFQDNMPRGEFTLICAGAIPQPIIVDWDAIAQQFNSLLTTGISRREAAKILAARYDVSSKDVYALGLKE
jgi:16S rRNA (cytidine1402-2'-O)-methyltransferase